MHTNIKIGIKQAQIVTELQIERLEALVSEYREFSQVMNEILNLK